MAIFSSQVSVIGENSVGTQLTLPPLPQSFTEGASLYVWSDYGEDGFGWGVYQRIVASDGTFLTEQTQVATSTIGDQIYSGMYPLDGGGWVVSWVQTGGNSGTNGLYWQVFNADGTKSGGEVFAVGSDASGTVSGVADDGSLIVQWRYGGTEETHLQHFSVSGTPTGPEFLKAGYAVADIVPLDDGYAAFYSTHLSGFEGSGDGNATGEIMVQLFDDSGNTVGAANLVNQFTDGRQASIDTSSLANGTTLVTWHSSGLHGRLYASDGEPIGSEIVLMTSTRRDDFESRITPMPDGTFYVVQKELTQLGPKVYVQHFSSFGQSLGGVFAPQGMDIVVLENGQFAVIVDSTSIQLYDADGSTVGPAVPLFTGTWESTAAGGGVAISFEKYGPTDFKVTAYANNGGDTFQLVSRDFSVHNASPSGAHNILFANEGQDYHFDVSDFGFSDVDGDELLAVILTSLPTTGVLKLNDVEVTEGQQVLAADLAKLTFTPLSDHTGQAASSFSFQVRDSGGTLFGGADTDQTPNNITFDVNSLPTATDADIAVEEDALHTFSISDFGFADADGDNLSYITLVELPVDGTTLFDGVALDPADTNIITASALEAGRLTWRPSENSNGTALASLTFTVTDDSDGALTSDSHTLTLNVAAVNDPPMGADSQWVYFSNGSDGLYSLFVPSDFGFEDVDWGDYLSGVEVAALPTLGELTLNGVPVTVGQIIGVDELEDLVLDVGDPTEHPTAEIEFRVIDSQGLAGYESTTYQITYNIRPTGADYSIIILTTKEDGVFDFFLEEDFGFNDADTQDSFGSIQLASLPTLGNLYFDGVPVSVGQIISAADLDELVFDIGEPSGHPTASFDFFVVDDLEASSKNPYTYTLAFDVRPTVANAIADQAATEDSPFTFQVPSAAFADVDVGDTLTYTATLADGSVLPDWLSFDAATRTFSGTPLNDNVGTISVKVTATDDSSASVSDTFDITVANTNDAPTVANAIADQAATEDSAFMFQIPSSAFEDVDVGDMLTYSATLADGSELPSWLSFDASTRTFSGTPLNDNVGTISVKVTATDGSSASASDMFDITVANVNDAPTGASKTIAIQEDTAHSFVASDFSFADIENDAFAGITVVSVGDGSLTLNGIAVSAGQFIASAVIGQLSWTAGEDVNGDGIGAFTFTVHDDGGTESGGIDVSGETYALDFNVSEVVDRFIGTKKKDKLVGTDGSDILDGKKANDKLTGGLGDDMITGGAGKDRFIFRTGDGSDTIKDFDAVGKDHDILDLRGLASIISFADLKANHIDRIGNKVIIDGLDGDEIVLNDVRIKDLDAGDFLF